VREVEAKQTIHAQAAGGAGLTTSKYPAYLRVHRSTIYRLLKHRQIRAFQVGRDWRFNIEEIDRWRLAQGKLSG
jgi:excisionase family DNA binding protein